MNAAEKINEFFLSNTPKSESGHAEAEFLGAIAQHAGWLIASMSASCSDPVIAELLLSEFANLVRQTVNERNKPKILN